MFFVESLSFWVCFFPAAKMAELQMLWLFLCVNHILLYDAKSVTAVLCVYPDQPVQHIVGAPFDMKLVMHFHWIQSTLLKMCLM